MIHEQASKTFNNKTIHISNISTKIPTVTPKNKNMKFNNILNNQTRRRESFQSTGNSMLEFHKTNMVSPKNQDLKLNINQQFLATNYNSSSSATSSI